MNDRKKRDDGDHHLMTMMVIFCVFDPRVCRSCRKIIYRRDAVKRGLTEAERRMEQQKEAGKQEAADSSSHSQNERRKSCRILLFLDPRFHETHAYRLSSSCMTVMTSGSGS